MTHVLLLIVWLLLPQSPFKNKILTRLGHPVHPTARARRSVVWKVARISMGPDSQIGPMNLFKHMREVRLDESASVGRLNVVSSHPVFGRLYTHGATLSLGTKAKITSRHQLDCSGGVHLGPFASIAGHQTRVLTHGVDLSRDAQAAYPLRIGERSFVGARCLLLGGGQLPDRSVLGAGSVLPRTDELGEPGLYAGVPAKFKAQVGGAWFDRSSRETRAVYIPETDSVVENGF